MLPSTLRISKTEFKTLGRGYSYHSPVLSLYIYKKTDQTPSQFSFLCSKKVAKSAVDRNRLRRRGYNTLTKVLIKIQPGFYGVYSFKKGAEKSTFSEINGTVLQLLTQSGIM